MHHTPHTTAAKPILTREPTTAVEDLLREILDRLDHSREAPGQAPEHSNGAGTVVLDVQVDGIAYKLLRDATPVAQHRALLSPREQEIVRLVAKGLPSKAIADVLDISLWTVATHLRRIFAKLGVGTRAEMIARVIGGGLLDGSAGAPNE
jgi:DNA-binding CsgD family transcriptional regulator